MTQQKVTLIKNKRKSLGVELCTGHTICERQKSYSGLRKMFPTSCIQSKSYKTTSISLQHLFICIVMKLMLMELHDICTSNVTFYFKCVQTKVNGTQQPVSLK